MAISHAVHPVRVNVRPPIVAKRLVNGEGSGGQVDSGVVLKTVLADVVQHLLKVGHAHHAKLPEGLERIVSHFALAHKCREAAREVIGADATEGERLGARTRPLLVP